MYKKCFLNKVLFKYDGKISDSGITDQDVIDYIIKQKLHQSWGGVANL